MLLKKQWPFWSCLLLIFISRLPFINLGYGAEEDAWGLRIVAENISRTGIYEVSRLPGHPFQELIYSLIWQYGHLTFNLLTLLISTAGIAFFMLSLKKLNVHSYVAAGIALTFTPVVFINSMNAMDYTWAMSFILIAFYFLISKRLMWAGVFLGIAAGCRITSGAMLIPFIWYVFDVKQLGISVKKTTLISVALLIVSCIMFLPVYKVYGFSFFNYYEHFEIPPFAKNIYKGTIGVWGTIGCIAVVTGMVIGVLKLRSASISDIKPAADHRFIIFCLLVIILYLIAFIRLPLKSAFLIPLIPFVILFIALHLESKWLKVFAFSMVISSLLFGVNLSDPNRGSKASAFAFDFNLKGQQISFDPLIGPVMADYTKQKNMISYAEKSISKSKQLNKKAVIISGWYLNFIQTLKNESNDSIVFVYYIDEQTVLTYIEKGYTLYYLTDQDKFNNLRFKSMFTNEYTSPLFNEVKSVRRL